MKRIVKETPTNLMGENYRLILVSKIDEYKAKAGITRDTILSKMVFGADRGFVSRVREGNFTLEKALRLEEWLNKALDMIDQKIPPGELPPIIKPTIAAKAAKAAKTVPAVTKPVRKRKAG